MGIALLEHLCQLDIGVSSFASVGDKYDVSSNDMLMWWEQDELTRLAVLYVESFGSPRSFARTARRIGRQLPVLTVIGGRSAAGQRVITSHPAAAATPLIEQEALFAQAGIIATHGLGELVEAAALMAWQPLTAGNRVAIVSNTGGASVLAADACGDYSLQLAALNAATRRGLRRLLPGGAQIAGPVNTTTAVSADTFRACLEEVAADEGVDAVLAIAVPPTISDMRPAIAATATAKPVVAVLLDQAESVTLLRREAGPASELPPNPGFGPSRGLDDRLARASAADGIPAYAYPETAARALGHAARYRAWRDQQDSWTPDIAGLRVAAARELLAAFLTTSPDGGWLPSELANRLLSCYQIQIATTSLDGVEVYVGVVREPVFGPLIVCGSGGSAADAAGDRAARLAPLTQTDADQLVQHLGTALVQRGHGGDSAAGAQALAGLLLRVSHLADDLPEVTELTLRHVMAGLDGACTIDARILLTLDTARDPFLRRLR